MAITSATGSGNMRITFPSPGISAGKANTIQVYYRGFRLSEVTPGNTLGHYQFEWAGATGASEIESVFIFERADIQALDGLLTAAEAFVEIIDFGITSA